MPSDAKWAGTNARRSAKAEADFRQRLIDYGVTSLWTEWQGTKTKYHCLCAKGHECWIKPNYLQQGDGPCVKCGAILRGQMATAKAEIRFRENLAAIGATPVYDEWRGVHEPHDAICREGHPCNPQPVNIQGGQGPCLTCAGLDPVAYEAEYRELLTAVGATPAWTEWLGANEPHAIICPQGHKVERRPTYVRQGGAVCSVCTGRAPGMAEAKFRRRLAELGATPIYSQWEGGRVPHDVICAAGHACSPRPDGVIRGQGICTDCGGHDPVAAAVRFRARLVELGTTPIWDQWLGSKNPHEAICAEGHRCWPRPNDIQRGRGPCGTCAGNDPAAAEAECKRRLAELGATPTWSEWKGTTAPHGIICSKGHPDRVRPSNIRLGKDPCRKCAKKWNIFYIVVNDTLGWVKFGITSESPLPRLKAHKTDGFRRTVLVITMDGAKLLEEHVEDVLAAHGHRPVRGREYFLADALDLIQETAQSYVPETAAAA